MKGLIADEVTRLMNRLSELEKEKAELAAKVRKEDIDALKEKLSPRCVCIAYNQVRDAIDKDIRLAQQKLDEIVGDYVSHVESMLRTSMNQLLREVLDKCGIYDNLPYEKRIIFGQMVDNKVEEVIKKLK
jgi:hypothetical protein